ncbi:MAG: acyltransferase [Candidatus Omnitrophota bacterium]|jgi:galactoside O-acetyltransferase
MRKKFDMGKDVKIHPYAKIIHSGINLKIDDFAQIDDFVFIYAGKMCRIGKFTHISSFTSIIGGGEFILEDFAGLSAGCRIITGSDDFSGGFLSNPTIPAKYKNVVLGRVIIRKHVIIGTNSVILPGVTVGEGATVGAMCLVSKDLDPWGIYIGPQAKKVGMRDRGGVLSRETQFLNELKQNPFPRLELE